MKPFWDDAPKRTFAVVSALLDDMAASAKQ